MKISFIKTEKLSRAARKGLRARKEFLDHGRARFMAAFDASPMNAAARAATGTAAAARPAYAVSFFRFAVAAAAALAVLVGVSAYADTANVPITSPLYPLKRASEVVRLAFTPAPEKAKVQASFAVRRAQEIDELVASHPSSTLIPQLMKELDTDIGATVTASTTAVGSDTAGMEAPANSLNGEKNNGSEHGRDGGGGAFGVYCRALDTSAAGVLIGRLTNDLVDHPRTLADLYAQCGMRNGTATDTGAGAGASGTIMMPAPTAAASGTAATAAPRDANGEGGGGKSGNSDAGFGGRVHLGL